jgi:hypothetical protein
LGCSASWINNREGLYRQPLTRFDQTLKRQDKSGSAFNQKRNLSKLAQMIDLELLTETPQPT